MMFSSRGRRFGTLTALAVGGAMAAGGVLWVNARKRRDGA